MKRNIKSLLFSFFLLSCISLFTPHAYAESGASGSSATFAQILDTQSKDTRGEALKKYLVDNNSPLADFADIFIAEADKNGIPWDLLAGISGTESTLGQQVPSNCNNAWGYGIYGTQTRCFTSYQEAIAVISKAIRHDYIDGFGCKYVEDIGRYYASSPLWSIHTQYYMHQIEAYKESYDTQALPISL